MISNLSFNFLLCYDNNYNKQAEVAMLSLLNCSDSIINFYIIHSSEEEKYFLSKKILQHHNVGKVNVYKFKNPNSIKFENLTNAHVTEATYYRLFIDKYLDKTIQQLIYIDCDIVCVNNPLQNIKNQIKKLTQSEFTIAAVPEYIGSDGKHVDIFHKELNLESKDYFNAGVMLIDYQKWLKNNLGKHLLKTMLELKGIIKYWDQDVLNKFFDGKYLKLLEGMNKKFNNINHLNKITLDEISKKGSSTYFIHFAGKFKPWHIRGCVLTGSSLFQDVFLELNNYKPFIQISNRRNAIKQLISLSFLKNLLIQKNKTNTLIQIFYRIIFKSKAEK